MELWDDKHFRARTLIIQTSKKANLWLEELGGLEHQTALLMPVVFQKVQQQNQVLSYPKKVLGEAFLKQNEVLG